jgi:hypothetical protein
MNRLPVVGLALVLLGGCGSGWKEFSSEQGKFRILFPGTPAEKTQAFPLPSGGTTEVRSFSYEQKQPPLLFQVDYYDLPSSEEPPGGAGEAWWDRRREAILSNLQGGLLEEKVLTLQGHPGREFRFEVPRLDHLILVARVYVVHTRVYRVMVTGPREQVSAGDVLRFLDSFRLSSP